MPHIAEIDPRQSRKVHHSIHDLFIRRWSPRAMSGEAIPVQQVHRLFEAARWAPSAFNEQPWRFVYALRDTSAFPRFLNLLAEANQTWCGNAAMLMVVVAKKTFTHNAKPNGTAMFDAGAAWENLALQGTEMGLVVHGMAGFNHSTARVELGVPDDYEICAMVAVGKPGRTEDLPSKLAERENPSDRKPISEIIFEGGFKA